MMAPSRVAAYEVLRSVHLGRADAATAMARARGHLEDPRDRGLLSELVLGTLRWRGALDHLIAWAGERPIGKFDAEVVDILRLGAYQLLHLDRVPASAVVNDAVELSRYARRRSAAGTVNAILRRISRTRHQLPFPPESDQAAYLSVACSHPRWIVDRWMARLGFAATRAWVEFNNQPAPLAIRANTLRASREEVSSRLASAGATAVPTRFAPDGLIVTTGEGRAIELSEAGLCSIQDEASQLVGAYAASSLGERVLDACAAPGGKTIQLAAAMPDRGLLVATDLRPRRIRLLADRLAVAGPSVVRIARADVTRPLPFDRVFDCVLLDAPCSGLGTLRRDPDLKWRVRESDLAALAAVEAAMLDRVAEVVKPGGRLIYSTCSSESIENEAVFESFLGRHPEFEPPGRSAVVNLVPSGVARCLDSNGCLRTSPGEHGLEAFFAAMATRTTSR